MDTSNFRGLWVSNGLPPSILGDSKEAGMESGVRRARESATMDKAG